MSKEIADTVDNLRVSIQKKSMWSKVLLIGGILASFGLFIYLQIFRLNKTTVPSLENSIGIEAQLSNKGEIVLNGEYYDAIADPEAKGYMIASTGYITNVNPQSFTVTIDEEGIGKAYVLDEFTHVFFIYQLPKRGIRRLRRLSLVDFRVGLYATIYKKDDRYAFLVGEVK